MSGIPAPVAMPDAIAPIGRGMGDPVPAMGPPRPGDVDLLRAAGIRVEVDLSGSVTGGAIALPATPDRHVLVALVREDGGTWRAFRGLVPSEERGLPFADISERAGRKRATAARLDGLGILSGDPGIPIAEAHACMLGGGPALFGHILHMAHALAASERDGGGPPSRDAWRVAGLDRASGNHPAPDPMGFAGYNVHRVDAGPIGMTAPSREGFPARTPDPATLAAMDRAIGAWVSAMSGAIVGPVASPDLAPVWSWQLHGWLSDPVHGPRRIQAIRLQPAFAPVMARDPGTRAAIDGGRPFEAHLAMAIARWRSMAGLPVPGSALMRRLRTMPSRLLPGDIASLVAAASHMAIDRVPATSSAWFAMAVRCRTGFPLVRGLRAHDDPHWGAELAGLMRGPPPPPLSHLLPDAGLAHLDDLVEQVSRHLVAPVLDAEGYPSRPPARRAIARTIVVHGEAMERIRERSARWHADVLDGRDPADGLPDDATWPALFPEFIATNGVSIRCLANARDLRDEGARSTDSRGEDGLSHCVGTYGPRCLDGEVHVASVRRDGVRLSTLSLVPVDGGPAYAIEQHRGLANGDPPPDAEAAVSELMRHLERDPPRVPAFAMPVPSHGTDGDPGTDRACGTWSPYLPRRLRRGGPSAIRARIIALTQGVNVLP